MSEKRERMFCSMEQIVFYSIRRERPSDETRRGILPLRLRVLAVGQVLSFSIITFSLSHRSSPSSCYRSRSCRKDDYVQLLLIKIDIKSLHVPLFSLLSLSLSAHISHLCTVYTHSSFLRAYSFPCDSARCVLLVQSFFRLLANAGKQLSCTLVHSPLSKRQERVTTFL